MCAFDLDPALAAAVAQEPARFEVALDGPGLDAGEYRGRLFLSTLEVRAALYGEAGARMLLSMFDNGEDGVLCSRADVLGAPVTAVERLGISDATYQTPGAVLVEGHLPSCS